MESSYMKCKKVHAGKKKVHDVKQRHPYLATAQPFDIGAENHYVHSLGG